MSVIEDTGRVEQVEQQIRELLEINARQAAVIERLVARLVAHVQRLWSHNRVDPGASCIRGGIGASRGAFAPRSSIRG